MPSNPKPDELPQPIGDLDLSTAPLVLDQYLTRQSIIDRIVDRWDVDLHPQGGTLTHLELATVVDHVDPDEDRRPTRIQAKTGKSTLIKRLGRIYGFDAYDGQGYLQKSQLVHILLVVARGETPGRFTLPSDPNPPQASARFEGLLAAGEE